MNIYENYEISRTTQTTDSKVYLAVKRNVASINGISFNHMFYFQKKFESKKANCTVNGMMAAEFDPGFNSNHYYAFVEEGIVHSLDLKTFYFEKSGLGYVNREVISPDSLLKMSNKDEND